MKRFFLFITLLITVTGAFAQNGKSIYQKYSNAKDVSTVYVSPAMFRLIGKIPDLKIDGSDVDLSPIIRSLTGLYLIDSENPSVNAGLQADVERFIAAGDYELLLEANDAGQTVRIYSAGSDKIVNRFVMFAEDGGETTFVCIEGQIDRDQLEKILAEQMKR